MVASKAASSSAARTAMTSRRALGFDPVELGRGKALRERRAAREG